MDLKQSEALLANINEINTLSQLRSFRHQFQQAFEQSYMISDTVQSYDVINKMHDCIIKRSIQLAEQEMVGEGLGPPPSPYCYLLLGSAGRSEQTFGSDQDSALIFCGDEDLAAEHQHYFLQFADKVVSNLNQLGYPPCEGKVQSNELMWCKHIVNWERQINVWIGESDWESIRYLLICSDARPIYGDVSLYEEHLNIMHKKIAYTDGLFQRMVDNTIHHRVMVNVFGQLLTVKYGEYYGSIDIKYGAYIPFVNAVRWMAYRHGITASATLGRMEQLYLRRLISDDEYLSYRKAFVNFLRLRLIAGYKEDKGSFESIDMFMPKILNREGIKELKRDLKLGRKLQRFIQYYIRHSK